MIKSTCCKCETEMWLPDDLYSAARKSSNISFFCAYGHSQHFPEGELEIDKIRRERDALKQRVAQWMDEAADQRKAKELALRQAAASRGQVTKLRKRASAGVCPCCNRTFSDMARHMASKHPGFAAEQVV